MIKQIKFIIAGVALLVSQQTMAQCVVDAGADTIYSSCGANLYLSAFGLSDTAALSTDFDGGQIGAGWTSSATVLYNNPCGPSLDGTPSAWFGNVPFPRTLTTAGFDLSCGGQVCFDLDFAGDDVAGSDCEDPDLIDEGVYFQYSINGGATWVDIFYFEPIANYANQYYSWDTYCFPLPAAAFTANTMFQWTQPNASSTVNDHWGLDNVSIIPINCGYYYDWDNIPGSPDNPDQNVSVSTDSTFIVSYTDGVDACLDTVTILVQPVLAQATAVNTTVVCPSCTDLNVEFTNYNAGSIIDDFDPGLEGIMWSDIGLAQIGGVGNCGSVTGNAMYFKNTGTRSAETADIDATASCGWMSFSMFIGNANSGATCENADAGEDVLFQYSTNGGTTWTTVTTYFQSSWDGNSAWQSFNVPIPPMAQTTATRFRWVQPTFTNVQGDDAWALDEVNFQCTPPAFDVAWTPGLTLNDATLQMPTACPLDTTTYMATITDPTTGCTASSSVTVNVTCTCMIASATAVVSGCQPGNTFEVSGDFIYIENPGTGTIEVEVTNGSGTYTQSISGPFTDQTLTNYSVNGIPADGTPVTITIYFSDDLACTTTLNDMSPVQPSIQSTSGSGVYCFGDLIDEVLVDATGVGPFTIEYTLDGNAQTATSLTSPISLGNLPGDYQITGITDAACSNTANFNELIIEQPVPQVLSFENGGTYCADQNAEEVFVVVDGTNPFELSYTLDGTALSQQSTEDTIYIGNAPGTYAVVGIEDAGCYSAATGFETITIYALPVVDAGMDEVICENEQIALTATGALTYDWSTGLSNGTSFVPTGTDTYLVTGTDANGCIDTDEITITVEPTPQPTLMADSLSGCEPMSVNFTNTTIGNFVDCVWEFGDGSTGTGCTDVQNIYQNGGTYDVTLIVTSATGCTNSVTYDDYIYVEHLPAPSFIPSLHTVISLDTEVSFDNNSTGAVNYIWDFGDNSPTVTDVNPIHEFPDDATSGYLVTLYAFSAIGCVDSFTTVIQVNEEVIYYIPNAFTPDGDEFNQTFQPIFTAGFDAFDWNMKIYNRWGEIVFESENHTVGWDGTYNGTPVQDGTYLWTVEYKTIATDERRTDTGHVNVLR